MTAELYRCCPVCGQERLAELPLSELCDDVHDDERVCIDCGAAVFVDPFVVPVHVAAA